MFQPTNESYVRSMVEATIVQHSGETEVEQLLRQGTPYRESSLSHRGRDLLHILGHVLLGLGKRLEALDQSQEKVLTHQQTMHTM